MLFGHDGFVVTCTHPSTTALALRHPSIIPIARNPPSQNRFLLYHDHTHHKLCFPK